MSVRLISILALVVALPSGIRAQDAPPSLRAGTLSEGLSVDGVLDEAAWSTAELVDQFTQSDPDEARKATARTTVRVLANAGAIAIGIVCEQAEGDIVSFSVRRDAGLNNEDHVRIVLGPFMDGRSGYLLAVNPTAQA